MRARADGSRRLGRSRGILLLALAIALSARGVRAAPDDPDSAAGPAEQVPQRDVMDLFDEWILKRRVEPEVEVSTPSGITWSILPSIGYNPVYGWAFGGSASGAGRIGAAPRPSALSIGATYSTTGQIQVQFRGDLFWSDYLLRADVRYLDTERSTWGLGEITEEQQEYPMAFVLTRFYGTLFRRVSGSVYLGLGYHHDEFADIVDERADKGEATPFTEYSGPGVTTTRAAGISLNLLGDTRNSIVNPTSGFFLSSSFRDYVEGLGSDQNWQEFWVEARMYPHVPVGPENVLAFWIYSWFTFGKAPYLDLPSIGWDTQGRSGRGYLQGRIRGPDLVYFETEYRVQLTRDGLLGGVLFYNVTTTSSPQPGTFGDADHSGGAGLRFKFNKRSNTNLTLDYARGEAGSKGFFMGMSEVF